MMDLTQSARSDAASEIAAEMFLGAGEVFVCHGDDPENRAILLAATVFFVDKIDRELFPGFARSLRAMLEESK
jgi:hypothetical protein